LIAACSDTCVFIRICVKTIALWKGLLVMESQYAGTVRENLSILFENMPKGLEKLLGAVRQGDEYSFRAFGEDCRIRRCSVLLSGKEVLDQRALLISLYALNRSPEEILIEPFISFRDFPDSMPYHGAFSNNSERVLIPYVDMIYQSRDSIRRKFCCPKPNIDMPGDFSLLLPALPKIYLNYIFYLADEEFPASVKCLFSANALSFMPVDGLADVAEYASRAVLEQIGCLS